MVVADMVKQRTRLSHRRLRSAECETDRRQRSDCEGVALTHADNRYLEVRSYDYEAPTWRQWMVTVTDRVTGASVTLVGEVLNDASSAALKQIGADGALRAAAA